MLEQVRQSVRDAMKAMPIQPQAIGQDVVRKQIKHDPDKVLGYVSMVTGKSGDDLLREVTAYQQAMKARFG